MQLHGVSIRGEYIFDRRTTTDCADVGRGEWTLIVYRVNLFGECVSFLSMLENSAQTLLPMITDTHTHSFRSGRMFGVQRRIVGWSKKRKAIQNP